jgi:hypothetical protein
MEKLYTEDELVKHNISHLKCILEARCLKTSGRKANLITRILEDQRSIPQTQKENLRDNTYFGLLPVEIVKEINKYRAENNPQNQIARKLIESLSPSYIEYEKLNIIFKKYNIPYSLALNEQRKQTAIEAEKVIKETGQNWYDVQHQMGIFDMPLFIINSTDGIIVSDKALIELIGTLVTRSSVSMDYVNETMEKCESDILITRINIGPREGERKDRYRYKIGHFQTDKEFVM